MSCSWTSLLSASASKSLHALITWTNLNLPTHAFLLHLLEKLHHLLMLPILHIFCKLLILCKNVQLQCAWCHCSHLCCHPWQVSSVLKPQIFPFLIMFEIWVPSLVHNQKSFRFPMGSHQVPNVLPRFPMCSPRVFPIAPCCNPICFAQSPPHILFHIN
jgi:hypothetical protein